MNRFVAFDVETPNPASDRMSAIGVAVVEGGRIVDEFSTLVNPETWFAPFHIALTGITPEAAARAPTFEALWPTLSPLLESGILLAHNAPFDMSVLSRCLRGYGIAWRETVTYVCTCQMGRRCCPDAANHRLDTLCAHFGIPLDHHRAGSDSRACAALLLRYLENGASVQPFLREYDLVHGRTKPRRRRPAKPAEPLFETQVPEKNVSD